MQEIMRYTLISVLFTLLGQNLANATGTCPNNNSGKVVPRLREALSS